MAIRPDQARMFLNRLGSAKLSRGVALAVAVTAGAPARGQSVEAGQGRVNGTVIAGGRVQNSILQLKPADSVFEGPPAKLETWTVPEKSAGLLGKEVGVDDVRLRPPAGAVLSINKYSKPPEYTWAAPEKDGKRVWQLVLTVRPKDDPKQQRPWVIWSDAGAVQLQRTDLFRYDVPKPAFRFGTIAGVPFTHTTATRTEADGSKYYFVDYVAFDAKRWIWLHGEAADLDSYYLVHAAARSFRLAKAGEPELLPFDLGEQLARAEKDPVAGVQIADMGRRAIPPLADVLVKGEGDKKAAQEMLLKVATRRDTPALEARAAAAKGAGAALAEVVKALREGPPTRSGRTVTLNVPPMTAAEEKSLGPAETVGAYSLRPPAGMKGEEAGGGATKRTWRDPDKGRELTVTLARKTATDSTPRVLTNGVHPPPGYQAWEAPDAVVDTATANGLSYVRAAKEAGGAGTVLYVAFDDDTVIEIRGSYKSPDDFFLLECAVATLRRG